MWLCVGVGGVVARPWRGLGAFGFVCSCWLWAWESGKLYDGEAARVVPAALLCGGGDASFLTVFFLFSFSSLLLLFVFLRGFLPEFSSRPGLPIDEARSMAWRS